MSKKTIRQRIKDAKKKRAKAQIKKALDTHLTYHDRSCLGVALL